MKRILVIDDEPGIVQLLQTLLVDEGYDVLAANSGESALSQLDSSDIDVILLDLMMPRMSGWDFMDELNKRRQAGQEKPLVAILSAVFKDEEIAKARDEYGASAYITKPFQIQELLDTLERLEI